MTDKSSRITNSPDTKDCPIINSNLCDWKFLYNSKYNNYNLPIYYCNECHLQRVHPLPQGIEKYYSEDYYKGKADYSYVDERDSYKYHSYVWDSRLKLILNEYTTKYGKFKVNKRDNNSKNNNSYTLTNSCSFSDLKILEVGSSFGGFLSRAKRMNMEVQGIEISDYAGNYANDTGIPTFIGTLEDANLPMNYYDIIVLNEVVEHLPDPRSSFDILVRFMSPYSILVIQTANFEGWQAQTEKENYHYYLPGHLYYYSENNLKQILNSRYNFHYKIFYGSDVSLFSKWMKMRGKFKNILDYTKWFKTAFYHFKSKFKYKGKPLTSGFVLYAFKGGKDLERVE